MELLASNRCVMVKGHAGAHTTGSFPCETGRSFIYVDAETAALFPACGNNGVMSAKELADALAQDGEG
jgi:hypothetical protein